MSVTAIVVNFNAGDCLRQCVQALLDSDSNVRVLVGDNASTDGSAEKLRALYGSYPGVEVVFNPRNLGFAGAVNALAGTVRSDWTLIINPDCVIERDAVSLLCGALEQDEHAGLAGPCVCDTGGRFERASLRRFPDPWNSLMTLTGLWRLGRWIPLFRGVPRSRASLPETVTNAEAVSGACMLLRTRVFSDVGYMDEGYGLHCEDLDLMYRLHLAGWHCLYVPQARATHAQGTSSRSRPLWVHRQKHRGMARFYRKFQADKYPAAFNWLVYTGIFLHYLLFIPVRWARK